MRTANVDNKGMTPYQRRLGALSNERTSYISQWQQISDYFQPKRGRFLVTDRNKGYNFNKRILDNTAKMAARTLSAGLMGGLTSPSRPWFRLATGDTEMMEFTPVKEYLRSVEKKMMHVFSQSNTYNAFHASYDELALFGTEATLTLEDHHDVIIDYPLTAGEYYIAQDHRGVVDTLYRQFQMTVAQVVGKFGIENVSDATRNLYESRNFDAWLTVVHAIEPRKTNDPNSPHAIDMPFKSVYFEYGGKKENQQLLSESGFHEFPATVTRWNVAGGDIYGFSPAMDALGDNLQLQHEQMRKAEAIDKMTDPPLVAPSSMKNAGINRFPGGITYSDDINAAQMRPLIDPNLRLDYLLADMQDVRGRINAAFYVDLFQMVSNLDKSGVTAREISVRNEEKLIMLGPVLERLQKEKLSRKIDRVFGILNRGGLLPEPPEELAGHPLDIEYVSVLAQAQKAVGLSSIDRLVSVVSSAAAVSPFVVDKIDFDQVVDEYSNILGTPTKITRSDDAVEAIRQQRQEAEQAQQQAAMAQQAVESAKTLADTSMDDGSALAGLMGG